MRTFKEIGLDSRTDKVRYHRYDRFYPMFLEGMRGDTFNMLEIGVLNKHSMYLWREYFPKAHIYGVDIGVEFKDERIDVFKFDQSKVEDLCEIKKIIPKCQFIIDDGSHVPDHQLLTFMELFSELLEWGGVYIIEDIECTYWHPDAEISGYKTGTTNLIDFFVGLVNGLNSEFSRVDNAYNISSIMFSYNCILIKKQTLEELEISKRPYRYSQLAGHNK